MDIVHYRQLKSEINDSYNTSCLRIERITRGISDIGLYAAFASFLLGLGWGIYRKYSPLPLEFRPSDSTYASSLHEGLSWYANNSHLPQTIASEVELMQLPQNLLNEMHAWRNQVAVVHNSAAILVNKLYQYQKSIDKEKQMNDLEKKYKNYINRPVIIGSSLTALCLSASAASLISRKILKKKKQNRRKDSLIDLELTRAGCTSQTSRYNN